jgi:DNA-binding response OmpR family regulator
MTRMLLIDGDRARSQSIALQCLESGVAIRLAETVCEGVRCLLDTPVSIVIVDSALMRLSSDAHARLFDSVAPGVPVVVLIDAATSIEQTVKLELQGFHVVPSSVGLPDLLAKVELAERWLPARAGAAADVDRVCR